MPRPVWNIPYNKAYKVRKRYETEILDEGTPNEQRNSLRDTAELRLMVEMDKSPAAFAALEALFDTCKGRAGAFDFTWATDRGGDGLTRIMRFDIDEIDYNIDRLKFRHVSVPIVTTVDDV